MKVIATVVGGVVLFLAVIFGLSYFDLGMTKFFAPRQEAIRNQVFHQSQAYTEGMVRDLENLRMQYLADTPEQQVALRSIILHRFSVYQGELPNNLQLFYSQLQSQQ